MVDPPSRSSAFRFEFDVPANYQDMDLSCGGLSVSVIPRYMY